MTTHADLSFAVRNLHRELIQAVQHEHAALYGQTTNPYEVLRLVQTDPLFAWLKPLTAAVAELDDADDPTEPGRLFRAIEGVEKLVGGGDAEFAALYGHYLRTVPEVTVAHGSVRGHLRALKGVKAA